MTIITEQVTEVNKIVVGIADLKVSATPGDLIITYALGSCLGICIYDPVARVGGLLHAMLPSASTNPERARDNPQRFVDTGLPMLFKETYALGASKGRIEVMVAGGASMSAHGSEDSFQIGKRNYVQLKKILWRNGVVVTDRDVGAGISRTVSLDISTGEVRIRSGRDEYSLSRQFPRDQETWR